MKFTPTARSVAALSAAVLLSGCGAGGPTVKSGQSGEELAKAIGCTGYKAEKKADLEIFVTGSGTCKLGGKEITAYYFNETTARENWYNTAKQMGDAFGMSAGHYLLGDYFAVIGDKDSLQKAQDQIGGDLK